MLTYIFMWRRYRFLSKFYWFQRWRMHKWWHVLFIAPKFWNKKCARCPIHAVYIFTMPCVLHCCWHLQQQTAAPSPRLSKSSWYYLYSLYIRWQEIFKNHVEHDRLSLLYTRIINSPTFEFLIVRALFFLLLLLLAFDTRHERETVYKYGKWKSKGGVSREAWWKLMRVISFSKELI